MKNEKIKEYLLENIDTLKDVVMELNSWNGCLDWLDYQENNEEFFEIYFGKKDEVARAICYGDYNYTDDFVRFNAYGNLESCNEWEYEDELKNYIDDIIDNLIDEQDNITIYDDELKELLDEDEDEDEDNEE